MGYHAVLSPSSADRWMTCPGSVKLCEGLPDPGSKYADEGTAAHFLAADCLTNEYSAGVHLGRSIYVRDGVTAWTEEAGPDIYEVDEDMVRYVDLYANAVRKQAVGGALFVEQAVPIDTWTQEPGATGSADAVVITADGELQVHDLKYGMGELVPAEQNKQLMLYALGAAEKFALVADFDRVRVFIHQPRINGSSDWSPATDELDLFAMRVTMGAEAVNYASGSILPSHEWNELYLTPSEKACRWCRAKADCPALYAAVAQAVGADFEDLDNDTEVDALVPSDPDLLSVKMAAVTLVEHWCKAVRAKVEAELFSAVPVPGWKLVQGKRGNRKWSNPVEAEKLLKERFRLKVEEMYDLKLISPTTAEKLQKAGTIGPRQWKLTEELITQDEGKPSVAPESDKRPALVVTPTVDDFEDLGDLT